MSRARPGYNGLNRDRSPPRPLDRAAPARDAASGIHPSRQAALDGNRDSPIAARGFADAQRGSYGPRGPAFSARGDYRGDFRDRDPPVRDRRDSPPWPGSDRDRSWRGRDSSRNRSPPRGRDARDIRDLDRRDSDFARPRRSSLDRGPPGPPFHDARNAGPPSAPRGYARGFRARGRGDYDSFRGRGRGFADDRDLFSGRSRSPRDRRVEPDSRLPLRRDDSWASKDDRPRDVDRFRDPPSASDDPVTRRSSFSSNAASTTLPQSLRRTSTVNLSESARSSGHDAWRNESSVARMTPQSAYQPPRASSPPRAPEVPAFGSVSVKSAMQSEGWNVWKAPVEPPKPPTAPAQMLKTSTSAPKLDQVKTPPAAPRAERVSVASASNATSAPFSTTSQPTSQSHSARTGTVQTSSVPAAPRGPSAQVPIAPTLIKSPPTGPRSALPTPGRRSSVRSDTQVPHVSPTMQSSSTAAAFATAPPGPRSTLASASSAAGPGGIPTGPRNMNARSSMAWQQRARAPPSQQVTNASSLLPAKRGLNGEQKDGSSANTTLHQLADEVEGKGKSFMPVAKTNASADDILSKQESDEDEEDEVDDMDLDQADFDDKTTEFERAKALLESKKHDLSSRHLRGATPLEQLGLLGALAQQDLQALLAARNGADPNEAAGPVADAGLAESTGGFTTRSGMPTPKAERQGEPGQMPNGGFESPGQETSRSPSSTYESVPSASPLAIRTPDLLALPFLNREPMTPFSEIDLCHENAQRNESLRDLVKARMLEDLDLRLRSGQDDVAEYASLYRTWKLHIKELDEIAAEEKERERQQSLEKSVAPEIPEPTPALLTPNEGTRRARAFHSEYHVQKVMEESKRLQEEVEAARKKDALDAMGPDYSREAQIPDMIPDAEARLCLFKDTSCMRNPHDAVVFYQLRPPRDTFTEAEHRTMVENFREYPKKWGKLTQGLHDRDYKDCINHYYATKWNKEFKQRPMKGKRRTLRGGKVPGKGRTNALISNLAGAEPDLYGGDETNAPLVAVTERGRPRRAAAPSFGDSKQEDQGQTPGKKPARPPMSTDASSEKVGRKPKTTTRGGGPRRARTQQGALKRSVSPHKMDPVPDMQVSTESDVGAPYSERDEYFPRTVPTHLHSETSRALMPQQRISDLTQVQGTVQDLHFSSASGLSGSFDLTKNVGQGLPKGIPSSYWAVREMDRFPEYIKHFGTDWQAISTQMGGSKSATMCKNYFSRLVSQGRSDLEDLAATADAKRGQSDPGVGARESLGSLATGRRRADEVHQMAHPRMLAPSSVSDATVEPSEKVVIVGPVSTTDLPNRYSAWNTSPRSSANLIPESASHRRHSRNTSSGQRSEPVDWIMGTSLAPQSGEARAWAPQGSSVPSEEAYVSRPIARAGAQFVEPPAEYRARVNEEEQRRASFEAEERRRYAQDRSRDYRLGFERAANTSVSQAASRQDQQQPQQQYAMPTERQSWSDRSAGRDNEPRATYPTLSSERAAKPPHTVSQYPRDGLQSSYGTSAPIFSPAQTPTFGPARPQLESRYEPVPRAPEMPSRLGQQSHAYMPDDGYPRSSSNIGVFDPVRRAPMREEETRIPPPSAAPAPPKAEPKRSNLMALLNNDDDPKPPRSAQAASTPSTQTRTPPQYAAQPAPPPRPTSRTERRELYGEVSRTSSGSYQPSPLGQPTHGSPPLAGREPISHNQSEHRPEWRSASRLSQYSQPGPSLSYSRPTDMPSILHRNGGASMHQMPSHPGNAGSPPPQQFAYGSTADARTSDAAHSRDSSFSRPAQPSYAPAAPQYGAPDRGSQYGPPHSTSHTPQPSYASSSYAPPPQSAPARYGTPSNQSAHAYNSGSAYQPPGSAAPSQHEYGAPVQSRHADRVAYEQQERERQREAELARPTGFGQSRYGSNRYGEPRR